MSSKVDKNLDLISSLQNTKMKTEEKEVNYNNYIKLKYIGKRRRQ